MHGLRFWALATVLALGAVVPSWAGRDGAILTATEGSVKARTSAQPQWHPAAVRSVYVPGDALMTARRSRAEVTFADGTIARVAPVSIYHFPKQAPESLGRLLFGRIFLKVAKQHAPIAVHTPSAVATVVGTELIVAVDGEDNTRVACLEGQVNVQGLQGPVVPVKAGQEVEVHMGAAVDTPTAIDVAKVRGLDSLLQLVKQEKGPEDDDPEGYKSLMKQLGEDPPSDPKPDQPPTEEQP